MPAILGTRTVFPVLRRARKRASQRSRDGEEAAHTATASHSEHVLDKSRIGEHVAAQTASPKCTRPTTIVNTTSSTAGPTTDEAPAIATPAHHPQRRRRRLSRFPTALSTLSPHRARKAAVTPPPPPPAVDLPPEECPICHDPVGVPNPEGVTESLVQLQCGHRFGQTCIITWVIDSLNRDYLVNPSCPVCRRDIVHPCGHLIVPREPQLVAAALHENDHEEALDDNGAGHGDHDDHAEAEALSRHRRRGPVLSQVVVGAKAAVILSVVLARLASHVMARTIRLVRGRSGRARKSEQSLFLTDTSDEVQMMPPEGHCRICKKAAGERLEDDDEPQAE